ncbi:MAG: sulfatase-like hydrolase/transferase, partial [Gemmataceae bacterium]|nr:sulfatase-like hydrolase/transferase [Gemmataceae bacterium]
MRAIVFVLRGCPAGCLGAYGNEWVQTPNLDRLAAEGVVFDRHVSDCPDPAAAARAWLTGRHQTPAIEPPTPGLTPGARPDLLSTLRAAGVRTLLVRANRPEADHPAPFYAGWDEVFDARPDGGTSRLEDALPSILDRLGQEVRWLVWVETDRLVPPWVIPDELFEAYTEDDEDESEDAESVEPWADPPAGPFPRADLAAWHRLHASHAAAVTALDADLGRVFEQLRSRGLDQTAAWLVT